MPTLNWIGKEDVEKHIKEIPTHLLRCDRNLSHGDPAFDLSPGTGNLIVEGDNLLALKALLPYYKNQVKCIYIDPPYNTGNEGWSYNDNVNSPQIRAWLGKVVDSEDLCRHDKWLCMMRPRLEYHHQLLRDDGTIFISIDDNEVHHLRALCDEIFGGSNFIANIVWQKRTSPDGRLNLGPAHDHIIAYARDKSSFNSNLVPLSEERSRAYKNPDNDPRGVWASVDITGQVGHATSSQFYTIETPTGLKMKPPTNRCWAMAESTFWELRNDNRIWFGEKGSSRPRLKKFLREAGMTTVWSWWGNGEVGHNQEAMQEVKSFFGEEETVFDTPKPTRLIERILQIATNPGDIILDSFAGSGTTGHAVLKMNAQHSDELPRRFILTEMEEKIARPITRERIKRAIEGYGKHKPLGGGFRFCHLGEPILDSEGSLNPKAAWRDLAHFFYLERFGTALESSKLDPETGFVGKAGGISLFLLFDGRSIAPLDSSTVKRLMEVGGPKIVLCESVGAPPALLERAQIAAYTVPYEVAF